LGGKYSKDIVHLFANGKDKFEPQITIDGSEPKWIDLEYPKWEILSKKIQKIMHFKGEFQA
jgi:hypothetical protein